MSREYLHLGFRSVPTRNEAQNLDDCLRCLTKLDEVVVFDSYSTDRTIEIAEKTVREVVQREFDNFSSHKNWALSNIPLRNKWVMFIDADEHVESGLADEIDRVFLDKDPK